MINIYKENLDNHLKEVMNNDLTNIYNKDNKRASWDDNIWIYVYEDGTKQNIYFLNPLLIKNPIRTKNYTKNEVLDNNKKKVAMAFTLHIISTFKNKESIRHILISGRYFHILIDELHLLNQDILNKIYSSKDDMRKLKDGSEFFYWCQDNGFIRKSLIKPKIKDVNARYADEREERKKSKLPDERALSALGGIFNQLIPRKTDDITPIYEGLRYHYVIGMSALAISSPNRVSAEQLTLRTQDLSKYTDVQLKDNQKIEKTVYWMEWQGSKNYKDNRNHILKSMKDPIERTLNFFNKICESTRVLCRFYENPTSPLHKLLGNFNSELISKFNLNIPVNIFQLGYILGFYKNQEQMIRLDSKPKEKTYKHISELKNSDKLRYRRDNLNTLIGCVSSKYNVMFDILGKNSTVEEFQKRWIQHIYIINPLFPYDRISSNKIKLSESLFCFNGAQLDLGCNQYPFQKSFYSIAKLSSLSTLFSRSLKKWTSNIKRGKNKTIFEHFGLGSDLYITPHQFRHWLNTKASESGIPIDIISMWSGRKNSNQTYEYIHIPDEDRISQIAFINTNEDINKKEIKLISFEEYKKATNNDSASITATGICTQNLITSPCIYLNDFVSHCTLCVYSCHVKGDSNALDILKKDYQIQKIRLYKVSKNPQIRNFKNLQEWFKIHFYNTKMLKKLIEIMTDKELKDGSLIRFIKNSNEFKISNSTTKKVNSLTVNIINVDKALNLIISNLKNNDKQEDSKELSLLLAKFKLNK
ncbi:tyrosine-type recombinase/integrase [Photobacterium carnosum]|uniref:Tyr recombinase domain-containing protein n=1 Tax=Photobacterium carnosum TaxID=2023717 RepID=A0A2N4UWI6_9GAMM|nr:tyrosine-type recombinase/integrase [Photobacterium carnosum]PLC59380.1 hypothetical protein CIK00_03665 [Photobacterium carnosum]